MYEVFIGVNADSMKRFVIILLACIIAALPSRAQDTTRADRTSSSQDIALYAMTGVLIPLAIAGTVISIIPPSGGIMMKDGVTYGTISFETGYGFGEKRETGVFTDYRFVLHYTHIYNSKVRDIFRTEIKRDFHFDFLDRRKIFLSGFHISAGLISDLPNHGFTVGMGLWIKSPWLPYFGLFPSHTYGLTYRYNKYFGGKDFHEISLGVTSAFAF